MKNFFDFMAPLYKKVESHSRKTFTKIEALVKFEQSDKVLDLGGGTGRITKFLSGQVRSITVIDPSEKMIEECKQNFPDICCLLATAEKIPLADYSVDKIIIIDAFHHFHDQEQAIKEMKRILTSGGKIIMEEFNPEKFGGKLIVLLEKIFRLDSIFHSPSSLAKLFSQNGFKVRIFDNNKTPYYLVIEK